METILIVEEVHQLHLEHWAQGLIGSPVPNYEHYIADKIIAFQVIEYPDNYAKVYLLLEAHHEDDSPIALDLRRAHQRVRQLREGK